MSLVPAMALHLYDDEGEEAPSERTVVHFGLRGKFVDPATGNERPVTAPKYTARKGYCRHCGKKVGAKLFLKAHEAICEARK